MHSPGDLEIYLLVAQVMLRNDQVIDRRVQIACASRFEKSLSELVAQCRQHRSAAAGIARVGESGAPQAYSWHSMRRGFISWASVSD
jgi:hypothetical protein